MKNLVFFDLETTGLYSPSYIIDCTIISKPIWNVNNDEAIVHSELFTLPSGIILPITIRSLTWINPVMLEWKSLFESSVSKKKLQEISNNLDNIIVTYNGLQFDYIMLNQHNYTNNTDFTFIPKYSIDCYLVAKNILKWYEVNFDYKLKLSHIYHGLCELGFIKYSQTWNLHTSLWDTKMLMEVFEWLISFYMSQHNTDRIETIGEFLRMTGFSTSQLISNKKEKEDEQLRMIQQGLMPFGKHKGCYITTIDKDYIIWCLENIPNLHESLKEQFLVVVNTNEQLEIDYINTINRNNT